MADAAGTPLSELPTFEAQLESMSDGLKLASVLSLTCLALSCSLGCVNACRHYRVMRAELRTRVFATPFRRAPVLISLIAPVYATYAVGSIFFMRLTILLHALATLWQALCLISFFNYVLSLLGGPRMTLKRMKSLGRRRWFATMPLTCCCRCLPKHVAKANILRIANIGVKQLVIVRCVVYLLWLAGLAVAGTDRDSSARVFTGVRALGLVISVSTLLGMWAFNILYKGVQPFLKHKRPMAKFIAVQALVVLGNLNSLVINNLSLEPSDSMFTKGGSRAGWTALIFTFQIAVVSVLFFYAFPVDEEDRKWLERQRRLTDLVDAIPGDVNAPARHHSSDSPQRQYSSQPAEATMPRVGALSVTRADPTETVGTAPAMSRQSQLAVELSSTLLRMGITRSASAARSSSGSASEGTGAAAAAGRRSRGKSGSSQHSASDAAHTDHVHVQVNPHSS